MALTACGGGLSDEEKAIVGNYYIPEVSDALPLIELHPDGTSVMRAIRPQVLTYAVDGTWHIDGDSLIIVNDLSSIEVDGDETLIGDISARSAHAIASKTDLTLSLIHDGGVIYEYHRRKN